MQRLKKLRYLSYFERVCGSYKVQNIFILTLKIYFVYIRKLLECFATLSDRTFGHVTSVLFRLFLRPGSLSLLRTLSPWTHQFFGRVDQNFHLVFTRSVGAGLLSSVFLWVYRVGPVITTRTNLYFRDPYSCKLFLISCPEPW